MIELLFWLMALLIVYVYFGYPLLLCALGKLWPASPIHKANITPKVSLIIAAYNEEKVIFRKIENTLAMDYPEERLQVIVSSDGSIDSTNEIVKAFAKRGVRLIALNSNQGKSSAQNRAVAETNGEIILFTDADILLRSDALNKLIRNFADESVGCVVGKIAYMNVNNASVGSREDLYWRYELFLRRLESKLGNFSMGSGVMAIRRTLFQPLDPNVSEDFVLPMQTAMAGYKVIYEPEAISMTFLRQTSARDLLQSKVRVISKDLRGLFHCRAILNPFRYVLYAWGLISHKLMRWLVPYFLITLFALNLLILNSTFYRPILVLQIVFYILALLGYLWQRKSKPPCILGIPFFFCLVNMAALVGMARFVMGEKAGQWEPVR